MRLGRVLYYVAFSALVLGAILFFGLPPLVAVAYAGLAIVGMVLLLRDETRLSGVAGVQRSAAYERARDEAQAGEAARAAGHEYDPAVASVRYLTEPVMFNFLWRFTTDVAPVEVTPLVLCRATLSDGSICHEKQRAHVQVTEYGRRLLAGRAFYSATTEERHVAAQEYQDYNGQHPPRYSTVPPLRAFGHGYFPIDLGGPCSIMCWDGDGCEMAAADHVTGPGIIDPAAAVGWALDCASHVVGIYERRYPDDRRASQLITVARAYVAGAASKEELAAANDSARTEWAYRAAKTAAPKTAAAASAYLAARLAYLAANIAAHPNVSSLALDDAATASHHAIEAASRAVSDPAAGERERQWQMGLLLGLVGTRPSTVTAGPREPRSQGTLQRR